MPVNVGIKTALRRLPYREMRDLSQEIAVELGSSIGAVSVADVLVDLPMDPDEKECNQEDLLTSCFSRKRSIAIQPKGNGWQITMSTTGIVVNCTNIREGMSEMFDILISYLALEGD